jgi:uncharacterized protein (TIGR03435 family)
LDESRPRAIDREELCAMLQAMLADRFQLNLHREVRQLAVYDLLVAKGGPKMKETEGGLTPLPPGLRAARGPVEVVVIDRIEKPSAN